MIARESFVGHRAQRWPPDSGGLGPILFRYITFEEKGERVE
jgi:hypothetical protein